MREYDFSVTRSAAIRLHTAGWPVAIVTVLPSQTIILRVLVTFPTTLEDLLSWVREVAGVDVHPVIDHGPC